MPGIREHIYKAFSSFASPRAGLQCHGFANDIKTCHHKLTDNLRYEHNSSC